MYSRTGDYDNTRVTVVLQPAVSNIPVAPATCNAPRQPSLPHVPVEDITLQHPVVQFLSSIHLQGHASSLIRTHGVATVEHLLQRVRSEDDAHKLGIATLAQQRALLAAVTKHRQQTEATGRKRNVGKSGKSANALLGATLVGGQRTLVEAESLRSTLVLPSPSILRPNTTAGASAENEFIVYSLNTTTEGSSTPPYFSMSPPCVGAPIPTTSSQLMLVVNSSGPPQRDGGLLAARRAVSTVVSASSQKLKTLLVDLEIEAQALMKKYDDRVLIALAEQRRQLSDLVASAVGVERDPLFGNGSTLSAADMESVIDDVLNNHTDGEGTDEVAPLMGFKAVLTVQPFYLMQQRPEEDEAKPESTKEVHASDVAMRITRPVARSLCERAATPFAPTGGTVLSQFVPNAVPNVEQACRSSSSSDDNEAAAAPRRSLRNRREADVTVITDSSSASSDDVSPDESGILFDSDTGFGLEPDGMDSYDSYDDGRPRDDLVNFSQFTDNNFCNDGTDQSDSDVEFTGRSAAHNNGASQQTAVMNSPLCAPVGRPPLATPLRTHLEGARAVNNISDVLPMREATALPLAAAEIEVAPLDKLLEMCRMYGLSTVPPSAGGGGDHEEWFKDMVNDGTGNSAPATPLCSQSGAYNRSPTMQHLNDSSLLSAVPPLEVSECFSNVSVASSNVSRQPFATRSDFLRHQLRTLICRHKFFNVITPSLLARVPSCSGVPYDPRVRSQSRLQRNVHDALTKTELELSRKRLRDETLCENMKCVIASLAFDSMQRQKQSSLSEATYVTRDAATGRVLAFCEKEPAATLFELCVLREDVSLEAVFAVASADFPHVSQAAVENLLKSSGAPVRLPSNPAKDAARGNWYKNKNRHHKR